MEDLNFTQIVKSATFISSGILLDHIYVNQCVEDGKMSSSVVSVYYSDHETIQLFLNL